MNNIISKLYQTKNFQLKKEVECNLDGELIIDKRFDISIIKEGIIIYYDQKLIDDIEKELKKQTIG